VLDTILYKSANRIKNELNKGLRKTVTSSASSIISSAPSPHININTCAVVPSDNYVLFDRKIDLTTEGIGSFFATKLRELPKNNAEFKSSDLIPSCQNQMMYLHYKEKPLQEQYNQYHLSLFNNSKLIL
jgi:hypothetical protein